MLASFSGVGLAAQLMGKVAERKLFAEGCMVRIMAEARLELLLACSSVS